MTETREKKTTVRIAGIEGTHEIAYGTAWGTPYTDHTGFVALHDAWEATRDAHHPGGYLEESDPADGFTVAWHDGDEMNLSRVYRDDSEIEGIDDFVYSLLGAPFELIVGGQES